MERPLILTSDSAIAYMLPTFSMLAFAGVLVYRSTEIERFTGCGVFDIGAKDIRLLVAQKSPADNAAATMRKIHP